MSKTELPLRDAIAEIVGSYPVDHYEAADDIIALLAPIGCSKCDADGVCSIAYCAEHDPRNAEQSEGSPSPLGSTLDEARAHRRQNPEYVEAENRIAAARSELHVHCQSCDAPLSIDQAESGLCGPCAVEWMEAQDHE